MSLAQISFEHHAFKNDVFTESWMRKCLKHTCQKLMYIPHYNWLSNQLLSDTTAFGC